MRTFFLILSFYYSISIFSQKTEKHSLKQKKEEIFKASKEAYLSKDTLTLNEKNKQLLNFFDKYKDSSLLAKYYHNKALLHKINYSPDSSFYYYNQSKNISKDLKDSIEVGKRLLSIAVLQRGIKDFLGSQISSINALQNLETTKSTKYLGTVYNNLGIIGEELNQVDEALSYYQIAIKFSLENKNDLEYLYIINNIGVLYQKKNQHAKAIPYFQKGLSFDKIEQKYPSHYAYLLENLAFSNYSLGKKEGALQQYNEVLSVRRRLKEFDNIAVTHINISNYYKDLNQPQKALFHSNEALKYAKQTHNNKKWLEALKNLANLTKGEESKQYLFEYITLNDSLFQNERRLKNQFAKIRYETDKKEKENVVLKTENQQKQAEITYQKQQKTIGWLVALSGLLFSGFSVLFYFQRKRKILYQAQLQKVEAREHERQQIAKSLHDEVAGDLRLLHQKLEKSNLLEEAVKLNSVKENVRNLSHQLSSISFDKVSFKDQIINLVSDYFELDFKIKVYGIRDYDWTSIDNSIKRLLYLSTRESIQNCKKYAKASTITIDFSVHKKYVHLNITDNGVGFNTKVSKKGIGLQNLQDRVEELNGTLTITSEIGKGTQTHIQIPFHV